MPDLWMDVDTALSEVPVNILPLLDDTDFKTRETAIAFNASGMDLVWNFVTTAGAFTQTAVTPTSGGAYDWTHQGDGMYTIEIPASAGASINNDTEGFGWFTGFVTGVLPWRGPVIGFRASGLNDLLIDSAFSTTRGLSGTALPNAAAEASGGLYTRGTGAGQINQDANGRLDANVAAISTDSTAADNLELATDGGSYNVGGGSVVAASVTGNVGGNVTGSIGSVASGGIAAASFAAGAIDATAIATNAIGSDELAASAITEIQAGLSTLDAAGVRTAVGLASANLDTQLTGIRNRQSTTVTKTATVQASGGNSATQILTDLAETPVDHWRYALVKITSGALAEQVRKVTGYDGAGTLTFTDGFTGTPANGVTIELVND